MDRKDLLKHIAETGYNVGFGAKKHFATFDIVNKAPGVISFISMAIGIYALVLDSLSTKGVSASLLVLGVVGLFLSSRTKKNKKFEKAGIDLTDIFNELKSLYITVKSCDDNDLTNQQNHLKDIEQRYNRLCMSEQILFSGWWAHYKFFWEHQIGWIEEQKEFKLFRDKIPLTLTLSIAFFLVMPICAIGWSLILEWIS